MKRTLIAVGVLVTLAADAQVVAVDAARITWTNATQLDNGQPIPTTGDLALAQTRIVRSLCNADGTFGATILQTLNVTPDVTTVLFEALTPVGKQCFRARYVQVNGELSPWSATVSKVISAPVPPKAKPPTITIS